MSSNRGNVVLLMAAVAVAACGYVAVARGTADDPASNFRLLIDTQTGHIFLADYQV